MDNEYHPNEDGGIAELNRYDTNAGVLNIGDKLTREQIIAIARLEDGFTSGRGMFVPVDCAEAVLHAFICRAMGDCVCREPHKTEEE